MDYTLVVTSCDRHDLLQQTLESFVEFADQKPSRTIIIEDSPRPMPGWIDSLRERLGGVLWIPNGKRLGQIVSIDRAYAEVETPFIFHCEDDWKFLRTGFISKSFDILDKYGAISTVSLRGDEWCHPWYMDPRFPFKIAQPGWCGGWGGFTFNPGLRRRGDYVRIGASYGKNVSYALSGCNHELLLSNKYLDMGYRVAWADDEAFVEHLGEGRSKAHTALPPPPKVLIAVPACARKEYGEWESGGEHEQRPNIHTSGLDDRTGAVRDTWWKDVASHPGVEAKFFYGNDGFGLWRRKGWTKSSLTVPTTTPVFPLKTRAICKWALEHDFDFVFKCDDDTAVYVDRLIAEIITRRPEYGGFLNGNVISGGPGYILSRRAMKFVAEMPITSWAEDVCVANALANKDFFPSMLEGHRPGFSEHWFFPQGFDPGRLNNKIISMHAVKPDDMRAWYAHKEQ
jgi:hypothetical protein